MLATIVRLVAILLVGLGCAMAAPGVDSAGVKLTACTAADSTIAYSHSQPALLFDVRSWALFNETGADPSKVDSSTCYFQACDNQPSPVFAALTPLAACNVTADAGIGVASTTGCFRLDLASAAPPVPIGTWSIVLACGTQPVLYSQRRDLVVMNQKPACRNQIVTVSAETGLNTTFTLESEDADADLVRYSVTNIEAMKNKLEGCAEIVFTDDTPACSKWVPYDKSSEPAEAKGSIKVATTLRYTVPMLAGPKPEQNTTLDTLEFVASDGLGGNCSGTVTFTYVTAGPPTADIVFPVTGLPSTFPRGLTLVAMRAELSPLDIAGSALTFRPSRDDNFPENLNVKICNLRTNVNTTVIMAWLRSPADHAAPPITGGCPEIPTGVLRTYVDPSNDRAAFTVAIVDTTRSAVDDKVLVGLTARGSMMNARNASVVIIVPGNADREVTSCQASTLDVTPGKEQVGEIVQSPTGKGLLLETTDCTNMNIVGYFATGSEAHEILPNYDKKAFVYPAHIASIKVTAGVGAANTACHVDFLNEARAHACQFTIRVGPVATTEAAATSIVSTPAEALTTAGATTSAAAPETTTTVAPAPATTTAAAPPTTLPPTDSNTPAPPSSSGDASNPTTPPITTAAPATTHAGPSPTSDDTRVVPPAVDSTSAMSFPFVLLILVAIGAGVYFRRDIVALVHRAQGNGGGGVGGGVGSHAGRIAVATRDSDDDSNDDGSSTAGGRPAHTSVGVSDSDGGTRARRPARHSTTASDNDNDSDGREMRPMRTATLKKPKGSAASDKPVAAVRKPGLLGAKRAPSAEPPRSAPAATAGAGSNAVHPAVAAQAAGRTGGGGTGWEVEDEEWE